MKKVIWFLIIIFVLGAIGIVYLYFSFEKPKQDEMKVELIGISIYALEGKEHIKTNYSIFVNDSLYKEGETIDGIILEEVPKDNIVKVINVNKENQSYYTTEISKLVSQAERFELNLVERGKIDYSYYREGDIVYLNLSSTGVYRNLHFCDKWSIHIITIETNFTQIPTSDFTSYHSCYDTELTLENDSIIIQFNMKWFDELDERDYIDLMIYDEDFNNESKYLNNTTNLHENSYIIKLDKISKDLNIY